MTAPPKTPVIGWTLEQGDKFHLLLVAHKCLVYGVGETKLGFDGLAFDVHHCEDPAEAQRAALAMTGTLEDTGCELKIRPHSVTLPNSPESVAAELQEVPVLRRKIISTLFLDGERLTPYA